MYGIIEKKGNETWYMIRGSAFTPQISEKYPIRTFLDRKTAESSLYWLGHGKPRDKRNFEIIKIKKKMIKSY